MVHVVGVTRFYVTITRPCPLDATIKTTQPAERPTDDHRGPRPHTPRADPGPSIECKQLLRAQVVASSG